MAFLTPSIPTSPASRVMMALAAVWYEAAASQSCTEYVGVVDGADVALSAHPDRMRHTSAAVMNHPDRTLAQQAGSARRATAGTVPPPSGQADVLLNASTGRRPLWSSREAGLASPPTGDNRRRTNPLPSIHRCAAAG